MPAIQPARLKLQTAKLARQAGDPAAFVRSLRELLEGYADQTHRPGQAGAPAPLIPAYHVPPQVLRQILRALEPALAADPSAALPLADMLWAERHLEPRLLAARLLGRAVPDPPEAVLERLRSWAASVREEVLVRALLIDGSARLRAQVPGRYLALVEGWLRDPEVSRQALGLLALLPFADDRDFANLPRIFQLVTAHTLEAPSELRPNLLAVVHALARRSPRETARFLRQSLFGQPDSVSAWLIRHSLDVFPAETQASLRAALREIA